MNSPLLYKKSDKSDILQHSQQAQRNPVFRWLDNEIIMFSRVETGFLKLVQDVSARFAAIGEADTTKDCVIAAHQLKAVVVAINSMKSPSLRRLTVIFIAAY